MNVEEQIVYRFSCEETIKDKEYFLNEVNNVLKNLYIDLEELKDDENISV